LCRVSKKEMATSGEGGRRGTVLSTSLGRALREEKKVYRALEKNITIRGLVRERQSQPLRKKGEGGEA